MTRSPVLLLRERYQWLKYTDTKYLFIRMYPIDVMKKNIITSHLYYIYFYLALPLLMLCGPPLLPGNVLFAQATMGAREIAIGQATTALVNSSWALFSNPSQISSASRSLGFYGIRYYGLPEVTDMAAQLSYPTRVGVFAVGAHRFGDDLYSENRFRLGYKHEYGGFHYGAAISYMHVIQGGGYGSLHALGIDAGLSMQLAGRLWLGARASNLNQPSFGSYSVGISEELPRELAIGFSYNLSDAALLAADLVKDVRFPFSFRSGVEVRIFDRLQGRAGITTDPVTYAMGFGWNAERWGVNVSVQQHEDRVLGTSPGVDLRLSW